MTSTYELRTEDSSESWEVIEPNDYPQWVKTVLDLVPDDQTSRAFIRHEDVSGDFYNEYRRVPHPTVEDVVKKTLEEYDGWGISFKIPAIAKALRDAGLLKEQA